ncbi:MAG TPA: hypothetical protein VEI02_06445 [Planctomycetota bacterium]|nr:hypothetical protein [Planctomycetota bacterium]
MLHSHRSRRFAPDVGASGSLTGKERAKLFSLFLLMAVTTAAVFGGLDSLTRGLSPRRAVATIPGEPAPKEELTVYPEVVRWTADPAWFDARVSEATPEDRVREYPEALKALADLVRFRPHQHFALDPEYREHLGFLTPTVDEVLEKPSGFRTKPVEFNGVLESAELVDTREAFGVDLNDRFASQWTGLVRVGEPGPEARYVSFLFFDVVEPDPPRLLGRQVRLQGVFYRKRDVKLGERYVTTAFVLGKKLTPALRVPRSTELSPDLAGRIRDAEINGQLVVYGDAFYEAFGYVNSNPPEHVLGADPPRVLQGRDGWDFSEELRLKPVRLRGRVMQIRYEPFQSEAGPYEMVRPSDAMATGWYTVYVSPTSEPFLYVVGLKDRPAGFEEGSEVEVDGLFYKRFAFQNRGTERPQDAPPEYDPKLHGRTRSAIVFAAGPLREMKPPPVRDQTGFALAVVTIALVIVVVFVVVVSRDRKRAREVGDALRRHKGARLRAHGVDLTRLAADVDRRRGKA